jgi:hypothetical protein
MECSISPIPDNCEHVADRGRLGIRAAWDPDFRDRGYDNYFESLDRFTTHLDFPRREKFADGGAEDRREVKRRRAIV